MKPLQRFLTAGMIIFILNIIWESSHHSLYLDLSGIPKYPHLIIASFADTLILIGIFVLVALKNKNFNWIRYPCKLDYLLVVVISLAVAIIIELINLKLGRWEYTTAMPTLFGMGLSPLIQLALTGIISLIMINFVEN